MQVRILLRGPSTLASTSPITENVMNHGSCLVLNQSYEFLSINPWFDAVGLILRGRATPLASYDTFVRSEKEQIPAPAVVVLKYFARVGRRRQSFTLPTHKNIWIREGGKCAYCGCPLTLKQVTKEHVHPRSKGGKDDLLNVVAACTPCNSEKADRVLSDVGMKLRDGVTLRHLTDEEKLSVIVKTHQVHERKAWLAFLKREGLTLF